MAKKVKSPLIATKAAINTILSYRKLHKQGKVAKIKELEAVSSFVTQKGTIKKRETRYAPAREALNKAIKTMQQTLGTKTAGTGVIQKYYNKITNERLNKAAQSYSRKYMPDNRFKRIAREKTDKYFTMVDIFASETYNKLREGAYGLSSGMVEALVDNLNGRELSKQDIIKYLEQVKDTLNDIPRKDWELATQDRFWNAVIDLSDTLAGDDGELAGDVLATYLTTPYNRENFKQALENYMSIDKDKNALSFGDAWKKVNQTSSPANYDNMYELFVDDEE